MNILVAVSFFYLGAIFGSYSIATIWRINQATKKTKLKLPSRSICENCGHILSVVDLIPIINYFMLKGRCRYCGVKIVPLSFYVEIGLGLYFYLVYILWPYGRDVFGYLYLILWLMISVGFTILAIYDFKWRILPTNVIYFTYIFVFVGLLIYIAKTHNFSVIFSHFIGLLLGGGIFYLLYHISSGSWIGGGDVRLGFLLGAIVGGPLNTIILMFISSVSALVFMYPYMLFKKMSKKSQIPFGPFLILGCIIVFIMGNSIKNYLLSKNIL